MQRVRALAAGEDGPGGTTLGTDMWVDLLEPIVSELPLAACASRGMRHPLSISRCERACGGVLFEGVCTAFAQHSVLLLSQVSAMFHL